MLLDFFISLNDFEKINDFLIKKDYKIKKENNKLIIKPSTRFPIFIGKTPKEVIFSTYVDPNKNDDFYSYNYYYYDYQDNELKIEFINNGLFELMDPNCEYIIDIKNNNYAKKFIFEWPKQIEKDLEELSYELKKLFLEFFQKNSFKSPVVLFSGGVDSSTIALILKNLNYKPKLITVGVENFANKDLVEAEKVANYLGLELKKVIITINDIEKSLKEIIEIIGSRNPVKVEVGLVGYLALKYVKGNDVFTGLGSEELFAGYERHKKDPFIESIVGYLNIYHRDVIRDFSIVKNFGFEPKMPFLYEPLVEFSLRIKNYKIQNGCKKYIFRLVAQQLGLPKEFAFRKKLAAQYGSSISKALEKIAKKYGFKYKKEFLKAI